MASAFIAKKLRLRFGDHAPNCHPVLLYFLGYVLEAEFVAGEKEPEVPVAIVDAAFR